MKKALASTFFAALAFLPCAAKAQNVTVDHFSQAEIIQKAQELQPQTAKGGSASVKISDYPNHYTMIALRNKSGGAEIHQNYADFFYVVQGDATLLTGGAVADETTTSPGEIKGSAVTGGIPTLLHKGDVVHIPAGVSHQLIIPEHGEFIYFVIKVKEQ